MLQRRLVGADAARGRRVVFIDAKATEPTLAAELIAAYTVGAGFVPRIKLWPAEPLSGWEGDPMELANRLLAVQDWSKPWYERVASRAIRLACGADIGPPRSAKELLARLTAPGLEHLYAGTDRADDPSPSRAGPGAGPAPARRHLDRLLPRLRLPAHPRPRQERCEQRARCRTCHICRYGSSA